MPGVTHPGIASLATPLCCAERGRGEFLPFSIS